MIYEKTISKKCDRNMTAAVISDEVERRSSIPRDMTYLVHKGKMEGKEGKSTKPNDDMVYLKRDIMEALKRSDEKWIATQGKPMKNGKLLKKD